MQKLRVVEINGEKCAKKIILPSTGFIPALATKGPILVPFTAKLSTLQKIALTGAIVKQVVAGEAIEVEVPSKGKKVVKEDKEAIALKEAELAKEEALKAEAAIEREKLAKEEAAKKEAANKEEGKKEGNKEGNKGKHNKKGRN